MPLSYRENEPFAALRICLSAFSSVSEVRPIDNATQHETIQHETRMNKRQRQRQDTRQDTKQQNTTQDKPIIPM